MRIPRLLPALLGLATIVLLLVSPPAFAQAPDLHDPGSITSWIKLQAMLVGLVLTVVWKYAPGLKEQSNRVILPWLQLVVFIVAIFGGKDIASAAVNPVAAAAHVTFWAKFGLVLLNKAVSKNIWDGLLKPTLGDALDYITNRQPQTP